MRQSNIHKAYNLFILNGSVFCDLVKGDYDPTHGYMVSLGEEETMHHIDLDSVVNYALLHKAKLNRGIRYLSIDYQEGTHFLDVYDLIEDRDNAIDIAKTRKLINIWDNKERSILHLPS